MLNYYDTSGEMELWRYGTCHSIRRQVDSFLSGMAITPRTIGEISIPSVYLQQPTTFGKLDTAKIHQNWVRVLLKSAQRPSEVTGRPVHRGTAD